MSLKNRLDKKLQQLVDSAKEIIEPGWLELYARSHRLSVEDELLKIKSCLRLAGLLN